MQFSVTTNLHWYTLVLAMVGSVVLALTDKISGGAALGLLAAAGGIGGISGATSAIVKAAKGN